MVWPGDSDHLWNAVIQGSKEFRAGRDQRGLLSQIKTTAGKRQGSVTWLAVGHGAPSVPSYGTGLCHTAHSVDTEPDHVFL